ncbi:MAG: hypothetical protein ACREJ9_03815 [Candidatus Rokuibacteriota bacterium]
MQTRVLTESDAKAYRLLRLRALGEEPLAFFRTPEEADSLDERKRRFILGAFDDGRLVGLVGCRRPEPAVKRRHIAMIWGMYLGHSRALRIGDRFYDGELMGASPAMT